MPEPTRQSFCCSQPEHGPTLATKCHRGGKKHTARPGLEPRTSRRPCEHSDHWATEPHGRPATISPCLIRFVPESARNHAGTDETVLLLLAARARPHTGHQMSQGRKKHMARPGLEPRTSRRPCEHSDHWATEPHGRPATQCSHQIVSKISGSGSG